MQTGANAHHSRHNGEPMQKRHGLSRPSSPDKELASSLEAATHSCFLVTEAQLHERKEGGI